MKHLCHALAILAILLGLTGRGVAADLENTLYLDLPKGRVVIEMLPNLAPNHVARLKLLVRRGYYDGIGFHRVLEGFMAQAGDPTGTGAGGTGHKIQAEFSHEHHVRGIVSMAREGNDVNSADSQFFIMTGEKPALDGKYTIWGRVVSGMEYVDALKKGDPANNGMVVHPDRIVRMQVAADAEKKG